MSDYEPYGPQWEREVGRLTKKQLIRMLATMGKERDFFKFKYDSLGAVINEGKQAIERSGK